MYTFPTLTFFSHLIFMAIGYNFSNYAISARNSKALEKANIEMEKEKLEE